MVKAAKCVNFVHKVGSLTVLFWVFGLFAYGCPDRPGRKVRCMSRKPRIEQGRRTLAVAAESPSTAAWRICTCLHRITNALPSGGNSLLVELLHGFALNELALTFTRRSRDGYPVVFDGAAGSLAAAAAGEHLAARAKGLGVARVPAGSKTRTRATGAEVLTEVWGETLGAASNAGVQRLFNAALVAMFPGSFAPWRGADPDHFALIVWAALAALPPDGLCDSDAMEMDKLRTDRAWQDALARIDYPRLTVSLSEALAPDLDAIEAELRLESEAALEKYNTTEEKQEREVPKHRMTVDDANEKAMKLAHRMRAGFFALSERQQAKLIGCSWTTWKRTPFYAEAQEKRPAGKQQQSSSPKTESLTAGREAVTGEGDKDEVLKHLIAEQEADKEPSPLESGPRKIHSRKRL